MSDRPAGRAAFRWERDMRGPVRAFLMSQGYRVYGDPDGGDYFDVVARRGAEVGLVELKLDRARLVLYQALRRRAWGDWTAVALGSERAARRLAAGATSPPREAVGIWWVRPDGVEVLRPARPRPRPPEGSPLRDARDAFDSWLDRVDRGEIPPGVEWEGLHREVHRLSRGRRFREWTLEESAGGDGREQR